MENSELWRKAELIFRKFEIKLPEGGEMIRILEDWQSWAARRGYAHDPSIFLVDYLIFHLHNNRHNAYFNTRVAVKNYFSQNSRNKFLAERNSKRVYCEDLWLKSGGIQRTELYDLIKNRKQRNPMEKYIEMLGEDVLKKINLEFEDDNLAFGRCKTNTMLWSPASRICAACRFIDKCKDELSKRNSELYKLRIEWSEKQKTQGA